MTNQFKYTPSANVNKIGEETSGSLRGNMGSAAFLERATGGSKIWSRSDAIRSAKATRPEVIKAYAPRIANVRRMPKIAGFHVIGLGQVAQLTLAELKVKLGAHGYNGYRVGGLKFNLFNKAV